jgi:tetratricopeptide (TPR) repeat protein
VILSNAGRDPATIKDAEFLRARTDFETENFESFKKLAVNFINKYSGTDDAEFLKFHIAIVEYRQEDWTGAVTSFDKFIEENPDSAFVARARLLKCRSLINSDRYSEFLTAATEFLEAHPDNSDAPFVVYHQAYSAWKLEDSDAAIKHATNVIDKHPGTEFACTVRMVLAEVHLGDARAHGVSGNFAEEKVSMSKALKALDEFRDEAKQLSRSSDVNQAFKKHLDDDILRSWQMQTD